MVGACKVYLYLESFFEDMRRKKKEWKGIEGEGGDRALVIIILMIKVMVMVMAEMV